MAIDTPGSPERASGLATALNVIVAPREAFETLRIAPTWAWAFIIAAVLMAIGTVLAFPASDHANLIMTQHMVAHSTFLANATDAQKQKMLADAQNPSLGKHILGIAISVVFLLIIAAFQALILLVGNALGGGRASYKQLFCSVMNIAIVGTGLMWVVLGIITILRGPATFSSPADLIGAVPGLGYIAGSASAGTATFLAAINIFTVWSAVLMATAMLIVARVSKPIAYSFAALILVLGAGVPALLAGMIPK
ncbi:MAG: YIP1 family protein [Candidatus Eremiobacteraeota bacterium]|nr:YIP1 family protein [Candidatus Eremiobacteraeota bacterium]